MNLQTQPARPRPPRLQQLEDRLTPSDSTGTALVKDINPGPDWSHIYWITDLNGSLIFSALDGGSGFQGTELFRSDGTAAGTTVLAGVEGLGPFVVIGRTAYFEGEDATTPDFELFKTDGTTAGTVWVNTTGNMSHPTNLTDVNGTLFFTGYDPARGYELWKSDGTDAGTALVKDINPGTGWSYPVSLTNVSGTLYFVANDGTPGGGLGLWKSDGTPAGTVLVKAFDGVSNLTNMNGKLFFNGDDGSHGAELWTSDGTARGTKMVKDIYSGSTTINEHYYGHSHVRFPHSSSPTGLVNVNGTLFITVYEATHGAELWKSDGTAKGTVLAADIVPGAGSSNPGAVTNAGGILFFTADTGSGRDLWKTDGTEAGTALVRDINPTGNAYPTNLTNANGTLYFAANDGTHGIELWKSNGMAAGTSLVRDINPGSADSGPAVLTVSGSHLFFRADDGTHGTELWDPPIAPAPVGGPSLDTRFALAPSTSGAAAAPPPAAGLIPPPPDAGPVAVPPPGPWYLAGNSVSPAGVGNGATPVGGPMPAVIVAEPNTAGLGSLPEVDGDSSPVPGPPIGIDLD